MNILLTNDDGIDSKGFAILNSLCKSIGIKNVQTIAPKRDKSGTSQSITLNIPIEFGKLDQNMFYVDGTPADCVITAMSGICEGLMKPDIVISGINIGMNVGIDTLYSGTIGAAIQANLLGLPSFAISQFYENKEDFFFNTENEIFLNIFKKIFNYVSAGKKDFLININIPCAKIKGVKILGEMEFIRDHNIVEKVGENNINIKMGKHMQAPKLLKDGYICINLIKCSREIEYGDIHKEISNVIESSI